MRRRRTPATAALVAMVVVGLAATSLIGWGLASRFEREPAPPAAHREARHRDLVDLRRRLIPSVAGGWVAETPAKEPSVENWLLAASQQPPPSRAFDRALDQAERRLDGTGDARPLSLVLAEVLPGPTADRRRSDRLAAEVFARSSAALDQGDSAWLSTVIQLSTGASPSAADAARWLETRAGPVGCDRIRGVADDLPPPGTALTIAVRVLAANGARCDGAPQVLAAALRDPVWDTWVAATEMADLATIGEPLPTPARQALAERFDGFLAVGPERPTDLGAVAVVQTARHRLDLPLRVSPELEHHLDGQVAHRGSLAGRSTSAPSAFDVAIVRQLAGTEMVPPGMLADTIAAFEPSTTSHPTDAIVDDLLVGDDAPACEEAPRRAPTRARVSFVGIVADQAWAVVRAHCADNLDLAATVAHIRSTADDDQLAVRVAAAELAACRLDPSALDHVPGRRLEASGAFATDPLLVLARAVAADPAAACRALPRR